MNNHDISRFK